MLKEKMENLTNINEGKIMENKEFTYKIDISLDLYKKVYKSMYFNNFILRNLMLLLFFQTLLLCITSRSIAFKFLYLFVFIFIVLLSQLKPIIEYRKAIKKKEEKIITINAKEIKVNDRVFSTNKVEKVFENNELYTLVIDYRFHVAVIKKNLDSIEEFETFMLNHFTGLKKKKIIQEKNIKTKTAIQFVLYFILFLGTLWVM